MSKKILLLLAGIILILAGCTTSSGGSAEPRPSWVDVPPSPTQTVYYFVGVGSDPAGNEGSARQMASSQLVSEITRFLGVKVTAETSVEAKDAYGVFETQVSQKISESSQARLGDLQVVETWSAKDGAGVAVFLLAEYDRGALLEEKARLEALFVEQEEAISGPELEGTQLMAEGEYYQAAVKFSEAAAAAVTSSVDNAEIKFERNINNAKDALSRITLTTLNDNVTGNLGEPLNSSFHLTVTDGEGSGLSGVDIRVSYKAVRRSGGRLTSTSQSRKTDSEGSLSFDRPPASFVGEDVLYMGIDFRAALDPLGEVPDALYPHVEGLEQVVNLKRVKYQYEIISQARTVPTAIMLLDRDRNGNPLNREDSSAGLLDALTDQGFTVYLHGAIPDYTRLSEAQLQSALRAELSGEYERVIYGFGIIDSFEESDGSVIVRVSGEAKAIDLETGAILFFANGQSLARGSSQTGTISAAFKKLGQQLGQEMVNNLP